MIRNIFLCAMPDNNIYVCSYNTISIICTKANTAFYKEGVLYVDGGWETIITKLRAIANDIGVQFLAKKHVVEIEHSEGKQRIHCVDDEVLK